jgi:Fe-S oxidoreductase
MTLEDYRNDMETCCRCSACKFIPLEKVEGYSNINVCPSISRYNFHAYSGGGRLGLGIAMLDKKIEYSSKKMQEVIFNCQMCGACDISCKYAMDMEVLEPLNEIRTEWVKQGNVSPVLDKMVTSMKTGGPMIAELKAKKGDWFASLEVKDYTRQKVKVVYHAGCRTFYDQTMWSVPQNAIKLMKKAGIEVGIAGKGGCCGGRAYQMGFPGESRQQANNFMDSLKKSGAKTLVTGCAECYYAFNVLYDKFGLKGDLEVLHTSQYFQRLIEEGRLTPLKPVNLTVTYHDPCHLGRLGENYIHWQGKRKEGQIILFDPPKEFRRGTRGVYKPPRELLGKVPGLKLVEMSRIKEYAWCCGAGGGVQETNPDFAAWTAAERIREARETEAEAIVTGCPGCETLFRSVNKRSANGLKVYDIVDLLAMAAL